MPVSVSVLEAVSVLPSAIVKVAAVAGGVKVILLTVVADATPKVGVVSTGEVSVLFVNVCAVVRSAVTAVLIDSVLPDLDNPVPAVICPAPENCVKVSDVVPSVIVSLVVST